MLAAYYSYSYTHRPAPAGSARARTVIMDPISHALPSIRTLPSEEARQLFSRAVGLVQQTPQVFASVGQWLDKHSSEQAVYQRMLPEKNREWDNEQRDLTAAPTKAELDGRATGQSWWCQ